MKTLSQTWFTEGFIDFELKKYTLLAYLQEVNRFFGQSKLYPQLADIIFHYNNLVHFRENKKILQDQFPRKLTGIQLEKLQLLYEQIIEDDELMQELEQIIHFSTNCIKKVINDGTEIYEFVESGLSIGPVGLIPLDNQEGYFFLSQGNSKDTLVYQYRLSIFEKHDEQYRSIRTTFIASWYRNIVNTYEQIKSDLIKQYKSLPNPAVYLIESKLKYPLEETILPIAKRSLVRYLSQPAA